MTITVTLPEGWYIAEILEDLYQGSAVVTHVIPRLAMRAGEVLDTNGVARMLYEVGREVKPLLAAIDENPLDKGDFEVIAGALCKGYWCGLCYLGDRKDRGDARTRSAVCQTIGRRPLTVHLRQKPTVCCRWTFVILSR